MIFMVLLLAGFIVGILLCMPLAPYVSPPTASIMIALFAPWMGLLLLAHIPIFNDIRNIYLSFIFGMCAYWTYYEILKKLKGEE